VKRLVAEGGDDHEGGRWVSLPEAGERGEPAPARHADVGNDEVHLDKTCQKVKEFPTIFDLKHVVSVLSERARDKRAQFEVVFGNKHASAVSHRLVSITLELRLDKMASAAA
jgi:hypothetical protein